MPTKLTLSVDAKVVEAAKRYAASRGRSVSQIVEAYLSAISAAADLESPPPQLARWRGSMSGVDREDHKTRLVEKYGA